MGLLPVECISESSSPEPCDVIRRFPPPPAPPGVIIISPFPPLESGTMGVIRFSFWRRLQNQTLTTSFSNCSSSESLAMSEADGLGCFMKLFSRAPLTVISILVRFFLFLPCAAILSMFVGLPVVESASSSHFSTRGLSLHMFLKLS